MPARPEGEASARVLARVYCLPNERALLDALCGLEREIGASLASGLDHQLAHARLTWWQEECTLCARGQPRHPLTREIAARCPDAALRKGLSGLTSVATWDLAAATFATRRELQAYCERWSAAMIELWVGLTAPQSAYAQLRVLGRALRETELLIALGPEARAGRLRLPLDELEHGGVTAAQLSLPTWPASLSALARARHCELRATLAAALASLTPLPATTLRPLAVWATVTAAQSHRAERRLPQAGGPATTGAALDGWRAWRAARAVSRRAAT
jgi:15-cis-phytoene synthase